ncbi:hypothetical protein [Streptomyces sp. NPDC050145]|uniref:hypothetical protein n=1 Tax=Streptomyces sp. NPDC050145 TaxID=3365602 RepID=UPI00378C9737
MKLSSPSPSADGPRPKFPWLLLFLTLVFAVIGWPLVASVLNGDGAQAPRPAPAKATGSARSAPEVSSPAGAVPGSAATAAAASPSASQRPAGELPPRGEGPAGDRAVQQLLESAWPADLPPNVAKQLLIQGRKVLLADITGLGQDRYPTAFPDARPATAAVAPAFTRIRIQAVIARKDTAPSRAVVHLVWAGADRGGSYTDGRITDIPFTPPTKDRSAWTPLPPATS